MFTKRRIFAWFLCLAMVLTIVGPAGVQAQESDTPVLETLESEMVVYGKEGETTYVPAGYTYVFEHENGEIYTQQAPTNMYISYEELSPEVAQQLAELTYGEETYMTADDGTVLVRRDYDAQEAAAFSSQVQAILNDAEVAEGDTLTVVSEAYTARTQVRAMIVFEDEPVIRMEGMSVKLGEGLGQAELNARAAIEQKQDTQIQSIEKKLGYDLQVTGNFSLLTNAVAVTVNYGDLKVINEMVGVKSAYIMPVFTAPQVNASVVDGSTITPSMKYAGPGMGMNGAWELGYKGEGMSVAIIDTGLSYENPSFTQEPVDQSLVAYTREEVEEILANNDLHAEAMAEDTSIDTVYYSSKVPFGFNYGDGLANYGTDDDTWMGHGTHVAGIVAGNLPEGAKEQFQMETMGIAPEAQLIIMKVFNMMGECYTDTLLQAMEDCIVLGVDCANLSLGSASGPQYLEGMTEVYDAAYEAGINVVVAAGNDASTGNKSLWGDGLVESSTVSTGTLGMPGTFDSVLTVASMENNSDVSFYPLWGQDVISWYNVGWQQWQFLSFSEAGNVTEGNGFKERLAGQYLPYTEDWKDAEGKLIFVPFEGGNADGVMAQAVAAKAAAVVLFDSTPGVEEHAYATKVSFELTRFDVPMAATSLREYDFLRARPPYDGLLRVDALWNPSRTAGEMSSFSSWGPTDGLTLKPEITGIGGNVFSAYCGYDFAVASGTSMASPAVAATAALVRQYLKTTSIADEDLAEVVNCLLMSTATPVFDEEHGTYYFVRRQGAGLANASAAIASEAYISVAGTNKAKLELGDDPDRTGEYTMEFEVVNFSDVDKTYTLDTTVLGQKAEGGQFKNGQVTYLTVDYARELESIVTSDLENGAVTVPANSTAKITVTVTLSDADKAYYEERFPYGAYVEGFIQLLSDETPNLSVPFLGFYGAYGEAPILEEGTYETLLGGDKYGYTTADQFHNSLWTTVNRYEGTIYQETYDHYLGDSRSSLIELVTPADWAPHENAFLFHPEAAGISPNADGSFDTFDLGLGLKRNAENIHYTVTNRETGEILWEQDTGFVSKSYYSSNYGMVLYGGAFVGEKLSLEWLYPGETDEWGNVNYDLTQCLLENNTWVDITATVTPEYQSNVKNANDTVTFSLYLDTEGPVDMDTATYSAAVSQTPFGEMTMYGFEAMCDEYWFLDYFTELNLYYDENGEWLGNMYIGAYEAYPLPSGKDSSAVNAIGSGSNRIQNRRTIYSVYDYAGNVSVLDFYEGSKSTQYVELEADKTAISVGETATVTNVYEHDVIDFQIEWKVDDPTVAEIVESDGYSITVKGLSRGTVTVSGGFGDYMKSIEIEVVDPAFEALRGKFVDVPGHWAEEEILEAVWRGLFEGTGKDTFSPNAALTRAQLVTVLYRMAGSPEVTGDSSFMDVPANTWYTDAIAWGKETGIVKGITEDTFQPNASVSREQFATFLYRYAEFAGEDVTARADLSAYTDADTIRDYAADAMSWAVAQGYIQGTNAATLSPNTAATRAQAATILIRYLTK